MNNTNNNDESDEKLESRLQALLVDTYLESVSENKPLPKMSAQEIADSVGVSAEEIEEIEASALAKLAKRGITRSHLEDWVEESNSQIDSEGNKWFPKR